MTKVIKIVTDPEDKARRQHAMSVMLESVNPLDLTVKDLLEVTLNLYTNWIVSLGISDEVGIQAVVSCLHELRARKASEIRTTIN
jgi:hypothetical protein